MKKFPSITFALVALLALSGCAPSDATRWKAGDGEIKIVASTNVWGSVANLIAGDLATVDAIIYNVNQDPHSYELSARDQLMINEADIVIVNGGGYDDLIKQAVDADPTPAITVDAFMASGDDETRNEHIWYDVDQVGDVASVIGAAVEELNPSQAESIEKRVDQFRQQLAERKDRLDALRKAPKKVFLTEPLIEYLVEDAGYVNLTPTEFSDAIEEERDVPITLMNSVKTMLKTGEVDAIYYNTNTKTAQIDSLMRAKSANQWYAFSELLPQDDLTSGFTGDYFDMLDAAIKILEEN